MRHVCSCILGKMSVYVLSLGQEVSAPAARPAVTKQRIRFKVLVRCVIQTATSRIFRVRRTLTCPPSLPRNTDHSQTYLAEPPRDTFPLLPASKLLLLVRLSLRVSVCLYVSLRVSALRPR